MLDAGRRVLSAGERRPYGPRCRWGDVMGIKIEYSRDAAPSSSAFLGLGKPQEGGSSSSSYPIHGTLYVYRNGVSLGPAFTFLPSAIRPVVALLVGGTRVCVDLGVTGIACSMNSCVGVGSHPFADRRSRNVHAALHDDAVQREKRMVELHRKKEEAWKQRIHGDSSGPH